MGLGGFLEALLGLLVAGVLVRMVLAGDLTERLLDLFRLGVLGDTEDLVVILLHPVFLAHRPTSFPVWSRHSAGTETTTRAGRTT
ncbi:hypothetical protein SDC9_193301 [bioreactor metagenome]|uniref:Uncharacterized protein n=1 Tax=bioreactor metagenome TaxID=1076179 RepID=A0A645I371_9ZZZZ